jgi:hypothetical protein
MNVTKDRLRARIRGSRITTILAPVTAAAAVLAVLAALSGVAPANAAPSAGSALGSRPATVSLRSVPQYYMALVNIRNPNIYGPQKAVIRDTVTGATIAMIFPPKGYSTFLSLTGAADDRTFVLSAEAGKWPANGATKFYLARFDAADGHVTLTALRIPEIPEADLLTGLALSANGKELAMAVLTGKNRAVAEVSVYSLRTGKVRSWRSTGTIGYSLYDTNSISWSRGGTLAFNWFFNGPVVSGQLPAGDGIWLLNTRKPAGSLLAHSRLAVLNKGAGFQRYAFSWDGVLTPDGTKVVVPVYQGFGPSTYAFEEFFVRTGRLFRILDKVSTSATGQNALEWTSLSGGVLVVAAPPKPNGKIVYGVLSGNRFIPIPKAPSVTSPELELAF